MSTLAQIGQTVATLCYKVWSVGIPDSIRGRQPLPWCGTCPAADRGLVLEDLSWNVLLSLLSQPENPVGCVHTSTCQRCSEGISECSILLSCSSYFISCLHQLPWNVLYLHVYLWHIWDLDVASRLTRPWETARIYKPSCTVSVGVMVLMNKRSLKVKKYLPF